MSQSSRRRVRVVAPIGVISLTAALGVAESAHAAECTITGISPSSVTVGLSDVTKTWKVLTSGCTVVGWGIAFETPWDGVFPLVAQSQKTSTIKKTTLVNGMAGVVPVHVAVNASGAGLVQRDVDVSLKRRTTWSSTFNASPEPVTKGRNITIKGTLGRANWNTREYQGYSGRRVWVQFRPAGSSTFTTVKKDTTGTRGRVSTTVKAAEDGTWRLYYAGNTTSGVAASTADAVDVR